METQAVLTLANRHGLFLREHITFNEMGIDFKVGFARDLEGTAWVLRIPRRADLGNQIEQERKILMLAKKHLSVAVPDWKIANAELIAYPLLQDKPVLTYNAETYEVTWHMDQDNPNYVPSLARVLVNLHCIPNSEVEAVGIKSLTPQETRKEILERVETVKKELGIGADLESRWRRWLDNDILWPPFTCFVHGDLYAGHILASKSGEISGIIDWSEGQVSDPAMDFSGHSAVFGEESLKQLIKEYKQLGGKTWDKLYEQALERQASSPLNYAFFAINSNDETHLQAAKIQLGIS
jgi:macrolide phosphotransferase